MVHHLPGPITAATQSQILLGLQQLHDEILRLVVQVDHVVPPDYLAPHDLLVEPHQTGVQEGRLAQQHLVYEDAQ